MLRLIVTFQTNRIENLLAQKKNVDDTLTAGEHQFHNNIGSRGDGGGGVVVVGDNDDNGSGGNGRRLCIELKRVKTI